MAERLAGSQEVVGSTPIRSIMAIFNKTVYVILLLLAVAFSVWSYSNSLKIKKEIAAAIQELDSKIEASENKILKLQKEGFVEKDEFSDIAERIRNAAVLISNREKIKKFSISENILLVKGDVPFEGVGTGFFINPDGYIATAKHVVDAIGEKEIFIKTSGNKEYRVVLIKADEKSDIAILKISGKSPAFVQLGHYDNLKVGEEVGFIGFSLNTGITDQLVHQGMVSAKGVDNNGSKIFTINAFVNKGNSGGPVFSAKTGRVLGIISGRQRDISSEKFITLPPNYQSGLMLGSIDPLKLNIQLFNETLKVVGDVSQVGIGIIYSADELRKMME